MPDPYVTTGTLREDAASGLYRGVRRHDGVPVLIRTVRSSPASTRAAERLRHEYEILRGLEGPWVPAVHALDTRPGRLRLVLAGVPGRLLSDQPARPMDTAAFLDLALQLTAAVADMHRQGVVHGDLTPANVVVDPSTCAVTLLGFGIATRLSHVPVAPRGTHLVEGSPAYLSPEQTGRVNRGVDHRSDLYSLGVILYELLTGELPFQAADVVEWMHCHIARAPRPADAVVPTVPAGLALVVGKLLAKQADERYQSASGLIADLERCRGEWQARGDVQAFPLGAHDTSDRFLISPRLYGRDAELAALTESFGRLVATGRRELVLVSGYSGVGKSSLVRELQRPVVEARGYFVAGKHDQYQRDVPYAIVVAAVQDLMQQILAEPDARIAAWRAALTAALGPNGQVIVDLVPQLELVVGPQPPVPTLLPTEAEHRLKLTFQRLVGALATREHPLVMFLDDLQWLDPASLDLLAYLLTTPDEQALLVIGAYRDNEVGPAHPLARTLDEIRRAGVTPRHLVLQPLPPTDLTDLVADTLRQPQQAAASLAALVHDKTAGNPFFAIHFLTMLYQEGLLAHDPVSGRWNADLAAIRRQGFTDNVVDLMLGRLRRTSVAAQEALTLAACVGSTVDAQVLALLTGRGADELDRILAEAVAEGLLSPGDGSYTFLHDRVQEAAYALLAPPRRPEQHLRIGRLLLADTPVERSAERIFLVVGQLNRGASLIDSAAESERLVELNLVAGRQAKASSAFVAARTYLTAGVERLDATAWERSHDLTFDLFAELGECEYLIGNYARSSELLSLALDHAESLLERARIQRLRQRLFQLAGRFHDALAVSLEALRLFGVPLPETDEEILAATESEIRRIPQNLGGRSIRDLADAPLTDDAETRALIGLLAEAMPLIYGVRALLWPLVTARGVNVCLRRGHAEESPFVYSCYAMVLVGVSRDIPSAHQFSELALALNERFASAAAWRGKLLVHHAALINIWREHVAVSLPLVDRAFHACLESGDLVHAGYITYNAIWLHLENGAPLQQVIELAHGYAEYARQSHIDVVQYVDRIEEKFAACLRGRTRSAVDFSDDTFDETAAVAAVEQAGFGLGVAYHHIMKLIAAVLAGRFEEALEWADRAAPKMLHVASMVNEATYHFFDALTVAALYEEVDARRQPEFRRRLEADLERLTYWAEHCPDNFGYRHALVRAELARIDGAQLEAMRWYDEAVRSAEENGFGHGEALAAELAAHFYRARGFDRIAVTYLRQARAGYARWGADAAVRRLDERHPLPVETSALVPTALFSAEADQLDLLSVVKASQAISSELVLPHLHQTLLRLALEHAGAQRGVLLLAEPDALTVRARAEVVGDTTRVEIVDPCPASPAELPLTLLTYVRRSGEAVVLARAEDEAEGRYAFDEYLVAKQPRSLLALPMMRRSRLVGILYLENNLVSGAFHSGRLAVLELLAAQAVISLESARLYADLQQENAERRRAEHEVRQLNRELEERVRDRTAELEATNAELEAFSSSVSHDLRAPLRAIHGFSEILLEDHADQLDAGARQLLVKVVRSSERMGHLIDALLSFSRFGRQGMSWQRVDLAALVTDVVRELEVEVRDREVVWSVGELPVVTGDRQLLRVVVVNLISNALKFSRSRTPAEIGIKATRQQDHVVLAVRDNGVGFDPRCADQLFGVFRRLHREQEFEGTGIGLATVRRIVERHGGRAWADALPGRGATFYVTVPA